MIIKVPQDAKIYDFRASVIWFDKDGVMYSVPKEDAPAQQGTAHIKEEMDRLRSLLGNKKVCMVLESNSRAASPTKEERDLIADEISSVAKALAIVSSSPLSRMAANLFFSFKPPAYPFKMFSNETDAKNWVSQFIDKP